MWFREETYESPFFDPQAYRVALDDTGRFVGLAGVEAVAFAAVPPSGLRRRWPRRGLGRALIAQALASLAEAGETLVTAEADAGNAASDALLRGFGATVTGGTRRHDRAAPSRFGRSLVCR